MRRLYEHPDAKDCYVEVHSTLRFPDKDYVKVKLRLVPKRGDYIIPGERSPKWYRISLKTLQQWSRVS